MDINSAKRKAEIEKEEFKQKDSKSSVIPSSSAKSPLIRSQTSKAPNAEKPGSTKGKAAPSTTYGPESDGNAFNGRRIARDRDSSEESDESNTPAWWDERYQQESAHFEKIANKRAMDRAKNTPQWPEQKVEKSDGKKKSGIQRSQTINLVVREHSRKSSLVSPKKESSSDFSLSVLVEGKWVSSNGDKTGLSVIEKIPVALRKDLAKGYRSFTAPGKYSHLQTVEKKAALRRKLALMFLYNILTGTGGGIDKERLESRTSINDYLSKTYGFRIKKNAEKSLSSTSSSKADEDLDDVLSMLVADASNLSKNYRVDHAINLRNLESDPFVKTTFMNSLENDRRLQKVSSESLTRSDVGGNFQRDFGLSVYEIEGADGAVKTLASVDEFVAFIGDPGKTRLPFEISLFACQSLGTFVKNTLFTRKNADGSLDSPLKLYDDTPVSIGMTPKASYRFKKNADGTVLLCYRAEYNSTGTSALGKNSAQIWSLGANGLESKGVLIDGAKAKISLDIVFHPNASFEMGALVLEAEGWNVLDG